MPKPSAVRKASGRIVQIRRDRAAAKSCAVLENDSNSSMVLRVGGIRTIRPAACSASAKAGVIQEDSVSSIRSWTGTCPSGSLRQKETGIEPPGFDLRRDPVGIGDEKIGSEDEPFPPDQLRQGEPSLMEFQTIGGKAGGRFRSGQIDHSSAGIAGEEHPRLLKGLPDRGHKEAEGGRLRKVRFLEKTLRIGRAETADAGRKFRVRIGVVQAASGKDIGPAHEGLVPVAPHEEHLIRSLRPIAQQDHRCGIPRCPFPLRPFPHF